MLQSMVSQRVRHDLVTEQQLPKLNRVDISKYTNLGFQAESNRGVAN